MNKNKILIGITKDHELYFIEWEQGEYFSMCGTTLAIEERQAMEQYAREYLEDGELWKQAVEGDNTTLGLNDWVEHVLSIDGWESMHDIDYTFTNSPHNVDNLEYYATYSAGGQHVEQPENMAWYASAYIAENYAKMLDAWNAYHLKPTAPQAVLEMLEKASTYTDEDVQHCVEKIIKNKEAD